MGRTRRRLVGNAGLVLVESRFRGVAQRGWWRLFLNPADYLSAATEGDDVLGIRIAPGSAGFDNGGFATRVCLRVRKS